MKKFSKEQLDSIEKAVSDVRDAERDLNDEIKMFNEHMDGFRSDVELAIEKYNNKLASLKEVYTGLAETAREYYDERSEKWQEGDAGQAYSDWCDEMENVDLEPINIELPEEVNEPDYYTEVEELVPTQPND